MTNVLQFKQKPKSKQEGSAKGFALIHRKITDVPFYKKDSEAVHLWMHLILKVNHAPETVNTDYGAVVVGRGQVLTGSDKLSSETGISVDRIKYLLFKKFPKLGMISNYSPGKFTIVTIIKYDEYQGNLFHRESTEITPTNSIVEQRSGVVVHRDSSVITTNNNLLNNSITNVIESATQPEKPEKKKPAFTCEEVWQVLKDELPEARGWRMLDDYRRNLIRSFWKKANKITRELDGVPFSLDSFRSYLQYISENCRWMLEDRPDTRSGKIWHRKKFDAFLDEKVYLEVREGGKDDR